jgi:hypothetical protein
MTKTMPDANKAKVLWAKSQNMIQAFLREIEYARAEIGNDQEFSNWCYNELSLSVLTITRVADILNRVDAAKAKQDLANARAAEEAEKARQRRERLAIEEAERKQREEAKAAAAAEQAAQKAREQEQAKKERKKTSKQKNNAGWKKKLRSERREALRNLAQAAAAGGGRDVVLKSKNDPDIDNRISEADIVKWIKAAIDRCEQSRKEWIEASVDLALLLCEARARFPANQKFANWLDHHKIDISVKDRAALLQLGVSDRKSLLIIFTQTDRTSYQYIWNDVQAQVAAITKPQLVATE